MTSTVELEEQIDYEKLDELLEMDERINYNGTYINVKQLEKLKSYRKYMKDNKDKKIKYLQKVDNYGRYYAENSLSLQNLWQPIRHTISHKIYEDIDMVNAHPVILETYCKLNSIKCPCLTNLIMNYEKLVKDLMFRLELAREDVKKIIIRLMYQGSFIGISLDLKINMEYIPKWLKELQNEFRSICLQNYLLHKDKLSEIFKSYKKHIGFSISHNEQNEEEKKEEDKDKGECTEIRKNIHGSFLSLIIADIENMLLLKLKEKLENKGLEIGVLVFDGLMVKKNEKINIELLNEIRDEIYTETKYKINLKIKPMEKIII